MVLLDERPRASQVVQTHDPVVVAGGEVHSRGVVLQRGHALTEALMPRLRHAQRPDRLARARVEALHRAVLGADGDQPVLARDVHGS